MGKSYHLWRLEIFWGYMSKLTPSILTGVPVQTHWGDGTLTEAGRQQEYFKFLEAQGKSSKVKYPKNAQYVGTANIDYK